MPLWHWVPSGASLLSTFWRKFVIFVTCCRSEMCLYLHSVQVSHELALYVEQVRATGNMPWLEGISWSLVQLQASLTATSHERTLILYCYCRRFQRGQLCYRIFGRDHAAMYNIRLGQVNIYNIRQHVQGRRKDAIT